MGMLDDAIRDHLELKRRRGADPSEVAREQREALDMAEEPLDDADFAPHNEASVTAEAEGALAASVAEDGGGTAGETAELDMRTVLDADAEQTTLDAEEDSLEWETPDRSRPDPRDTAPETRQETPPGEHTADVLEQTPDFLRDTPEQERMWFEQRPPRDFDFDK
jgi:hypothetical protein